MPGPANEDDTVHQSRGPLLRLVLWVGAFVLAGLVVFFHRRVEPDDALRGTVEFGEITQAYTFPRTFELPVDDPAGRKSPGALVRLRLEGQAPAVTGAVLWREYPSEAPFSAAAFDETRNRVTTPGEGSRRWTDLAAGLPARPAGERLEYYVTLSSDDRESRLPVEGSVILRYLGFVPREILFPHVITILLAVLVGMRAALAAIFEPSTTRRFAWAAFVFLTLGGMTLGPFVQYYATGEYWMGFPTGGDWRNNAVLAIWLAWLVACVALGTTTSKIHGVSRVFVVAAACVTAGVFPIPYGFSSLLN